jgi:cbb3-type cytochrome oxidase subunit 1
MLVCRMRLVQWWYGHNAVAFFLTTPFLGLMYYFLPKAAEPSGLQLYRLSIIHFWSLIFLYIWAGPHHLLYSALAGMGTILGVVFSIMLIAPSWGGMLNGLLTLAWCVGPCARGPVLKFIVVAMTCVWYVHARRSIVEHQVPQQPSATSRTGPWPTCTSVAWAGTASSPSV